MLSIKIHCALVAFCIAWVEVLVKAHEVLLKEPVLNHRVSLRHVYPHVQHARLPLLPAVFAGLAAQEGYLQLLQGVLQIRVLLLCYD